LIRSGFLSVVRKCFVVLLASGAVLTAPSVAAAARTVPVGFIGVNYGDSVAYAPPTVQAREFARMARAGAESARVVFVWSDAQPNQGGPIDFSATDAIVATADLHGIDVLPMVAYAPPWARERADDGVSPPENPSDYANYLTALVKRYGPHGSFWMDNPTLARRPIRQWQIWNEPDLRAQFDPAPGESWAPVYGSLVRASYAAVKAADRGASVVLAGLTNYSFRDLGTLYSAGHVGGHFDVAAIHPYTSQSHGPLSLVKRFRQVMRDHGDGRKPIWVTETGLPASRGRVTATDSLQTTDSGMAKFLTQTYGDLVANRASLGIGRVYWYTWATTYGGNTRWNYAGLLRYDVNTYAVTQEPAFSAYVNAARRYEGCTKDSTARCVASPRRR